MVSIIMSKKTVNEKISEVFDTTFDTNEEKEEKKSLQKYSGSLHNEVDKEKDYFLVRKNMKELINTGEDAIEGILKVATEGDSPRAYEVAAQMIKTVAEMNQDLIDLHKKMKDIKKEETTINNRTQNTLYVGSTRDLQDLINESRSAKKALGDNIIDVEEIND